MRDHTKLRAFELADELAPAIYKLTCGFPREEQFGLTSQLRRAGRAIPSNIVEGCARQSEADYVRFLDVAYGSAREVEYITSAWSWTMTPTAPSQPSPKRRQRS